MKENNVVNSLLNKENISSNSEMEIYLIHQLTKSYDELNRLKEQFLYSNHNNKMLKQKHQLDKKYLESQLKERQDEINNLLQRIELLAHTNRSLDDDIRSLRRTISLFENSYSWKMTSLLRLSSKLIKRILKLLKKIIKQPSLIVKAFTSIQKYGLNHTIQKILNEAKNEKQLQELPININLMEQKNTYILTTKHCLFIAKLIKNSLSKLNINSQIIFEKPKPSGFGDGVHFVICPQMFDELPGIYIAYQLEQSINSRWFTDEYIRKLENSYAIFDYSLENINFLQSKGLYYQQMYFMPLAYLDEYNVRNSLKNVEEKYDVLFYGDINNERRKRFIDKLSEKFRVKVVKEIFGEELYKEIEQAKVVVNIHYYEGALLETTRLYECLSLNKLVVSETSSDIDKHQDMNDCIDFVEVGDINKMIERVDFWLKNEEKRKAKISKNIEYLNASPNWFEFYFMRFMLANDWITFDKFYDIAAQHIHFECDFICLGLPETVNRIESFRKDNHYDIQLFPALRHKKGWIGSGMSYKFMLKKAKELEFKQITICEDDVEFRNDFLEKYKSIKKYLNNKKNWDIFSGIIADLHSSVNIKEIDIFENTEYIYLNKMTSMVFNIYSQEFYDKLLVWNETDHNVETNAIDRFIESFSQCTTITTNPYLVGHKEELHSTLWGANNSIYSEMIKKSEDRLHKKIELFKRKAN